MPKLTTAQHLRRALASLVKARDVEPDDGYKADLHAIIVDVIHELRARRAAVTIRINGVEVAL